MRTLVIPDIHHKVARATRLLERETWDQAWLLGDIFDDFGDGRASAAKSTEWFRGLLNNPCVHSVLGNHDAHYLYPLVKEIRCSGWTRNKMDAITDILKPVSRFRRQLPLHVWVDDWLLSHGGFHPDFAHPVHGITQHWINHLMASALDCLERGEAVPVVNAGVIRGGSQNVGGINWLDWEELVPIPELNQLVGHTHGLRVRYKHTPESQNWCIDTGLRHYALITDGKLDIKEIPKNWL